MGLAILGLTIAKYAMISLDSNEAAAVYELKAADVEGQAKAKLVRSFVKEIMESEKTNDGATSENFNQVTLTLKAIDAFITWDAADKGNVVISPTGTTPIVRPANRQP